MSTVAPAAAPPERVRVAWLDWFRGAAVLAMIETHVANTFLAPGLREAAWFGWVNWFNGLIAPAFLFIAGYAQGMSWLGKRGAFGRKAKRLLGVAAVGYALHFPWGEIAHGNWAEAVRVGSQVDVLQCLAAALLGVLVVAWIFAEKGRHAVGRAVLAGLSVGTILLAPFSANWSGGPVPVAAFLNGRTGSLFPLFPWAAFVFCGALAGAAEGRGAGWLLVSAAGVRVVAWLASDGTFFALSPSFFGERLAWVLALAALCQWLARGWTPRPVLFAGRESLVMYAAHLLIIEAVAQTGGPRGGCGVAGAALLFGAVLTATFAVAFAWAKWRARRAG